MDWGRIILYGLVAIAIGLLIVLIQWQQRLQAVPAGLEFEPLDPNTAPPRDPALEQDTQALQTVGCTWIGDYHVTADVGQVSSPFIRLLHDRDRHYFVTLTPTGARPSSIECSVISLITEDWLVKTTNAPPKPITAQGHLPRQLWTAHPQATPVELVNSHLQQRQQVTSRLNLPVLEVSEADFWIKIKETTWRQKQRIKRQNLILSFWNSVAFKVRPQTQWLGDYGAIANSTPDEPFLPKR